MNDRLVFVLAAFVVATLLLAGTFWPASASGPCVDTLVDEEDGSCGDGDCALRDAIDAAGPGDTISFSVVGTITVALGHVDVDSDVTIAGPGADLLTISGGGSSRVLYVGSTGALTLSNVTVSGGYADKGGGIDNRGRLTLIECTIADKRRLFGNGARYGGGIKNEHAAATLTNCSFQGNAAANRGAGLDSGSTSTLSVNNCTFFNNTGIGFGNPSSTTTVKNTIIAGSSGSNCYGSFETASTNNLSTDSTCSGGITMVGLDDLDLLWGGWAVLLQETSVAVDAGDNATCAAVDQLGTPVRRMATTTTRTCVTWVPTNTSSRST